MAETNNKVGGEFRFGPEEVVNVSELHEFVFCQRAWYLACQGLAVSKQAQTR
jgi:hypothetical protein